MNSIAVKKNKKIDDPTPIYKRHNNMQAITYSDKEKIFIVTRAPKKRLCRSKKTNTVYTYGKSNPSGSQKYPKG